MIGKMVATLLTSPDVRASLKVSVIVCDTIL